MTTLRDALANARRQIEALDSDEAALEAELLLMHALRIDRPRLYERLQEPLDAGADDAFEALLQRRLAREPVAYITGRREFFGLDFEVSPAALIPRPETETLVELALAFTREHGGDVAIADIGT
ncbi:MAG: peptide chain release factor N(5)-glutamine methyltransferase, partial [Chloroflexota bacterium]